MKQAWSGGHCGAQARCSESAVESEIGKVWRKSAPALNQQKTTASDIGPQRARQLPDGAESIEVVHGVDDGASLIELQDAFDTSVELSLNGASAVEIGGALRRLL